MAENSIGEFLFLEIRGEVIPTREQLEMDQRNGINGTEFTLTGTKGEPFQLLTRVDAPSYPDALQFAQDYGSLIELGAQDLILHDVLFTQQVKVLKVTPVRIHAIRSGIGGIFYPSLGWIEAVWDLIAVDRS